MSNKNRIAKKRQKLTNKVEELRILKAIPQMINMIEIAKAAKKAAFAISGISPKKLEGFLAIEADRFGNRKTVFAGSRDYQS